MAGDVGLKVYCHLLQAGCEAAYECRKCATLQEALKNSRDEFPSHRWLCHDCLLGLRDSGLSYKIPGYYTEGSCQGKPCTRGKDKHTFLLQLVLFR